MARSSPCSPLRMAGRTSKLDRIHTQKLVETLFEEDLHARRVLSLANGVTGVLVLRAAHAERARHRRWGVPEKSRTILPLRRHRVWAVSCLVEGAKYTFLM